MSEVRPPALEELVRAVLASLGFSAAGEGTRDPFERVITRSLGFLDPFELLDRLDALMGQVCQIQIAGGKMYGTGFLVGADLVLTNHHVVRDLRRGEARGPGRGLYAAKDVNVRFDYRDRTADGDGAPVSVSLAADWLLDESPYSAADESRDCAVLPTMDELDYALLRLSHPVGEQPCVRRSGVSRARGWMDLPASVPELEAGSPLYILQHPRGLPLRLAQDTAGVLGFNDNRTRLRYRTNTDPGSSGAPCFDGRWNLVAIHHSSDLDPLIPRFNQGIPLDRVCERIERTLSRPFGRGEAGRVSLAVMAARAAATGWRREEMPTGLRRADEEGVYLWDDGDRKLGIEMVYVPPGEFGVGDDALPGAARAGVHRLERGFYVARYPTTVDEFRRFCEETGHRTLAELQRRALTWRQPGFAQDARHPVVCVSFEDACQYATWAGMRLPLEVEWECASRGAGGKGYPWGNDPPQDDRLWWSGMIEREGTCGVGQHPLGRAESGIEDASGNVWEWTMDLWASAPSEGGRAAVPSPFTPLRVVRGGSWCDHQAARVSTAWREVGDEKLAANNRGLRCVLDERSEPDTAASVQRPVT
ncbi:MAG: Glutamate synthase large chain [Myxococcaceae bacterium]|nr:Glutamate synthase large chain [Myxococcaceae bacterium]